MSEGRVCQDDSVCPASGRTNRSDSFLITQFHLIISKPVFKCLILNITIYVQVEQADGFEIPPRMFQTHMQGLDLNNTDKSRKETMTSIFELKLLSFQ